MRVDVTLFSILLSMIIYLFAILAHEIGHIIYLRRLGRKVKLSIHKKRGGLTIRVGLPSDYLDLTKDDLVNIYVYGIAAGFVVTLIPIAFNPVYMVVIPVYLVGCIPDFKKIYHQLARS